MSGISIDNFSGDNTIEPLLRSPDFQSLHVEPDHKSSGIIDKLATRNGKDWSKPPGVRIIIKYSTRFYVMHIIEHMFHE